METSDWGTRLDSLLNVAMEGKDPYASEKESLVEDEPSDEEATPNEDNEPEAETPEHEDEKEAPEPKDEEFKTPNNLTEKAAAKWGELRSKTKQIPMLTREIETLKAELEKAKTQTAPADTTEIDRLRSLNSEYESELSVSRIEATQEYKSQVLVPMGNLVGLLEVYAEKYGVSTRDMFQAFEEPDQAKQGDALTEMASQFQERDRLKFYDAADKYAEVVKKSEEFKTSAKERAFQKDESKQTALAADKLAAEKTVTEARAEYEKAADKTFQELKNSVSVLKDEKIAADVQRLAKGDFTNADASLKAYLAHSGALLPHLLASVKDAEAKLAKANKTIASYRNGAPRAGAGRAETSSTLDSGVGFLEALDAQLG